MACILIKGFYAKTIGNHEVSPLVVHREKLVLDANRAALDLGARVGQPLSEAKAVLMGNAKFVAWQEDPYRAESHRWLDVCAEVSDTIEPLEQHRALINLSGHGRPDEIAGFLRQRLMEVTGLEIGIGLGPVRWVAELAAQVGDDSLVPLLTPRRFLSPLPTNVLPIPIEIANRLTALGYRKIGDVAALPAELLRQQFGNEGYDVVSACRGGGNPQIDPVYPPSSVASRMTFAGTLEDREQLKAALNRLSELLEKKLKDRDFVARDVSVVIEGGEGSLTTLSRNFTKPMNSRTQLLAALSLLLAEDIAPPSAMLVRLTNLTVATDVQQNLCGLNGAQEKATSIESALARVRNVFGNKSIERLSEREVGRFQKVRLAWSQFNGWNWG